MTVVGEKCVEEISDAGSIPASSIRIRWDSQDSAVFLFDNMDVMAKQKSRVNSALPWQGNLSYATHGKSLSRYKLFLTGDHW